MSYSNINAKLRGMYAKSLNKQDLYELMKQTDLKSAIYILKNKEDVLQDISDEADRLELEESLDRIFIKDIKKIYRLLNESDKKIFKQYISKYEVECIKKVLKNIGLQSKIDNSLGDIDLWTKNIFTKIENISQAENFEQFINIVKKSEYYKSIKEYQKENEEIDSKTIETIENNMDKQYFEELYKMVKNEKKEILEIIGTEIDLLNILGIYRMKKYYKLDKEEIENRLISVNYKLSKETIWQLINANNEEEFFYIISKTKYIVIEMDNKENIEKNIKIYEYKMYKRYFRENKFNISTVISYMNLQKINIRNIINIIGGIIYKLDINQIENRIIV